MNIKDKFLYFTYNGVHSSEYGAFYENNGEDISFPFSHNISHELATPLYQNRVYWLGANKESKEFQLNIAVTEKTLFETEEIFEWLDPTTPGKLVIDYRPNYSYEVLITNISAPTMIPRMLSNGLVKNILMFSVTFTTYNNHLAETIEPYSTNVEDWLLNKEVWHEPDYLYPIMISNTKGIYNFVNWSKENQYIKINAISSVFEVKKSDKKGVKTFYKYSLPTNKSVRLNTEIGSLIESGKLLEFNFPKEEILNKGPMPIEPGSVFRGKIKIEKNGSIATVKLNNKFKEFGLAKDFIMVFELQIDEETPMVELDKREGDKYTGTYPGAEYQGKKFVMFPDYLIGSLQGDSINFNILDIELPSDLSSVKVNIAVINKIEVTAADHVLEMKYRKGV